MRWFFLFLILVNIVVVSLVFNANLNAPRPTDVKPQQSVAFPASLVMMNELETLPTEIIEAPLTNVSDNDSSSIIIDQTGAVFESVVAYNELDVLQNEPLDGDVELSNQEDYEPSGLSRVCINLTNLEKDEDMTSVIDMLTKAEINPEVYNDSSPYYWVYIPPYEIEGSASNTITRIRDLNLDAHLLKDGKHRGGISTGVFVSERNATRYAKRLRELGFNANIEERNRKKYRIVVGRKFVRTFNSKVYEALRRQFNFVAIDEEPC